VVDWPTSVGIMTKTTGLETSFVTGYGTQPGSARCDDAVLHAAECNYKPPMARTIRT